MSGALLGEYACRAQWISLPGWRGRTRTLIRTPSACAGGSVPARRRGRGGRPRKLWLASGQDLGVCRAGFSGGTTAISPPRDKM